jgi:hypothetical protein
VRYKILLGCSALQVVADEVRSAQEAASRRWETEVRSLKDFQSKNQKRLFLLEQERDQLRDQLHRASSSSEKASAQLRAAISGDACTSGLGCFAYSSPAWPLSLRVL